MNQLLFHKQTKAHIYYLRMTMGAKTLQFHLLVQIRVISFTEVMINFRGILLTTVRQLLAS